MTLAYRPFSELPKSPPKGYCNLLLSRIGLLPVAAKPFIASPVVDPQSLH
jgi:hypothetical protein